MFPIALSELKMLVRNRLVAICAIVIPLGLGLVLLMQGTSGAAEVFAAALDSGDRADLIG